MERGGTQGIGFFVSIIVARLLLPEDYGQIALIMILITIANVFVQSGFNTALIQKKDADEIDFSTVFYLGLFVAGVLYVILFLSSPFIANFYGESQLILLIKVLSITLFFDAINSIQNAIISRSMQFKKLFYSSIGSILVSGAVGIIMAYKGFGAWALVGQQLTNQLFSALIMWFTVKWRPKLLFSLIRLKGLISYGGNILIATLLGQLDLNLRSILIGKIYSNEMLGYFNRGKQFPELILTNIDGSIQSVMLPTYSSHQENRQKLKDMVRRSIVTSSFIIFPLMAGLAAVAEPLIKLLLTDKWLPSVPFLQIYCIIYAIMPIHSANLQAIKALGHSGTILRLEIIKTVLNLVILFITVSYGVYAMTWGIVIGSLISTVINSYPNIKILNYSFKEQWQDVLPSLLLSVAMGIVVYSIQFIGLTMEMTLIIQVCLGMSFYVALARVFKLECYTYLLNTTISIFQK